MRLTTLQCILLTLFPICCSAQVPSFDDLETRVRERLRSYDGMEFTISSSFFQEDLNEDVSIRNEAISLKNIRETVRLHFPEKGPVWQYWSQEIQDQFDDQWIINLFKVTNVRETHNFKYSDESKGRWNRADITPWYEWDEVDGRSFFTILGINIIGMSLFDADITTEFVSNAMSSGGKVRFVREYSFEGQSAFVFSSGEGTVSGEFHVLYPQGIVVHYEINWSGGKKKRIIHVESVAKTDDGIWYPKKGSFYQDAHTLNEYKSDYKFEVTDVRRLEPEILQSWFPEWPTGTSVHDVATDKSTRIPPSERQREKVTRLNSYEITPQSTLWLIFRIATVILGLAMILYAIYRLWRKK